MELTQIALIAAAKKMGISVDLLKGCATEHILFSKGNKEVLFCPDGVPIDNLSYEAFEITANKQLCKYYFQKMGLSYPQSISFTDFETSQKQLESFIKTGSLYVCKPLDGTEGRGVCMNLASLEEVERSWKKWKSSYQTFLLEEQVAGGDLRIQAVGGKLVAACIREPATVLGNGQYSLAQLVEKQQAIIHAQNPANSLDLDEASFELIEKQGLTLDSIPALGQKVQLKYVANMNQGATAIDITDEIHPDYQSWIERVATTLKLNIFALDVLTTDYRQAPNTNNAWALEINGHPYWYHHTFSERRTHDMAGMILRAVFG